MINSVQLKLEITLVRTRSIRASTNLIKIIYRSERITIKYSNKDLFPSENSTTSVILSTAKLEFQEKSITKELNNSIKQS